MSMRNRYQQIVDGLRIATKTVSRRRIGAATGISPEALGYWLGRENANPNINNLIAVEGWLLHHGFIEPDTHKHAEPELNKEVKDFDQVNKPTELTAA